jgi:CheY-like chemotaxis protein
LEQRECLIVLVVDDFDEARVSLAEFLSVAEGFRVETAADGQQAVDMALRTRPAVVVMDLAMPVMDGVEAVRRLKATPETRDIPVIVLTAFKPEDETPQRALEVGGAELMTKPVDPRHLVRRIRHYCEPPPAPQPALSV